MDQWPHLQPACVHFNSLQAPSELFFMKNLSPVQVHTCPAVLCRLCLIDQLCIRWFFPFGSSPPFSHKTVRSSLRRGLRLAWCFSTSFMGAQCWICFSSYQLRILLFRVVISCSVSLSCCLFRRQTSTLCIACRTSTSFHLTVQVDAQRHFSLVKHLSQDIIFSPKAHPWLQPSRMSSYSLTCPPSCFLSPNLPHYSSSLALSSSFLFDPLLLSRLCDIDFLGWVGDTHPQTDDCTLSLSCRLSCVTQNAPSITQNQRGTPAFTAKGMVTWRREMPGRKKRSWSSAKAWDALSDKSVLTLPHKVNICKHSS